MNKKFLKPEIEIEIISKNDIIVTSPTQSIDTEPHWFGENGGKNGL